MRIGELARRAEVSIQTVRYYERRRLLRAPRRTLSGYRDYSDGDLELVLAIKRMKRYGFTLREIRRVLQLWAVPGDDGQAPPHATGSHACLEELRAIGARKLAALESQLQALSQVRDELASAIAEVDTALGRKRRAHKRA